MRTFVRIDATEWAGAFGGIFIYGACVCAAQAEVRAASADNLPAREVCSDN